MELFFDRLQLRFDGRRRVDVIFGGQEPDEDLFHQRLVGGVGRGRVDVAAARRRRRRRPARPAALPPTKSKRNKDKPHNLTPLRSTFKSERSTYRGEVGRGRRGVRFLGRGEEGHGRVWQGLVQAHDVHHDRFLVRRVGVDVCSFGTRSRLASTRTHTHPNIEFESNPRLKPIAWH